MDNFIDKLAQKFSSQDMIHANLAAEAKESKKMREKVEGYENLLQEMRQVNLKNIESAERVNQMIQEGSRADEEYLQEIKQLNVKSMECMEAAERVNQMLQEGARADMEYMEELKKLNLKSMECMESAQRINQMLQDGVHTDKEYLQEMFAKADETLHAENVKVYRNVQAAVQNSLDEQTQTIAREQQRQLYRLQQQVDKILEDVEHQSRELHEQKETSRKQDAFVKMISVLILIGVAADVAIQVMTLMGVFR